MAIYKFCIVLYYCIINLELSGFVRFLACRLEQATAQLSARAVAVVRSTLHTESRIVPITELDAQCDKLTQGQNVYRRK